MKNVSRTLRSFRICLTAVAICAVWMSSNSFAAGQTVPEKAWKAVEAALGRSGKMQPGEVLKFSMPRKDMQVTIGGTPVKPGLALGSWAAFKKMGNTAMVMGRSCPG